VGLAVGAYLFQRGDITIGTVYLVYAYLQMIGLPVSFIMREFGDLQMAGASIQRVNELLDSAPKIQDGRGSRLPSGRLSVEFDDVSFAYNPEVLVLHGVSFRLEPGRTLGLLGRTGSGKTTMSRLLFRFYDPAEGTVRLGDVDVRKLHLNDLRRRVGMVTQEVQVFQATVRDNFTLFDPAIPDHAIVETLDSLGLGPWHKSLPDGLDTELSAGGGQLSAGQAQLLAFARVFLKKPDLVVLDEASSRLDLATERLIEQAVERLLADRTAIIIAHRLSTVERLDEIMIVEEGRVREHGERQALAKDPSSHFAGLLKTGLEEVLA
ncbi:MAG: ABC transporter ATP-binding protein, partial [Chloroflexi bacterium]|nr:ABC transporter ATP-binding protein [Chloroflexota bacterium]